MNNQRTIFKAAVIGAVIPTCAWLVYAYTILMANNIGWSGIEPIIIALIVMIFGAMVGVLVGSIVSEHRDS